MSDSDAKEIEIHQVEGALAELVTRAEYDIQIATARRYPRSIKQFIDEAMAIVTLNEQVADDCIYALPRDGKTIEGPSARFAEIILHAWKHIRAGTRIVNEDGRFITAQGVCHDLQSNTLIAYEVRRRITNKKGFRYNDDMIGVTGNAACSIALRDSITKIIPRALWEPIYQEARRVVVGDSRTLANRRALALAHLQKFGATEEMIFKKLGAKGVEDITLDHLVTLRGVATSLKDGDTTVEQVFNEDIEPQSVNSKVGALKERLKSQKEADSEAKDALDKSDNSQIGNPPFNLSEHNLKTQAGTKEAIRSLYVALESYPLEKRAGVFVASGGISLIKPAKDHGIGLQLDNFIKLGIILPDEV